VLTVYSVLAIAFFGALYIAVYRLETIMAKKISFVPGLILPGFFLLLWSTLFILKLRYVNFPYCITPDVYWNPLNPAFNYFQYRTFAFVFQVIATGLAVCASESCIIYYQERRKRYKKDKRR